MNSPSVGDVDVFSLNTSPSLTVSNVHDVKPSINTNLSSRLEGLLTNPTRKNTKDKCVAGAILDELDPESKEVIEKVLDDQRIMASSIHKILTEEGYKVAEVTFRRHRRKVCICFS